MKRAMRFVTFFICTSLTLVLMTPLALALNRRTHLTDFIASTKGTTGGFQATTLASTDSQGIPDLISSSYAINMSLYFGKTVKDVQDTSSWILDNLKTTDHGFRIGAGETKASMKGMYLAISALNSTGMINSLGLEFRTWITNQRNVSSGGFSDEEGGITTTMATYHAIDALYSFGNTSLLLSYNESLNFYFQNCSNSDGGFAEIIGQSSTLEGTWAAVAGLNRLALLVGFTLSDALNVTKTLQYVSQFYFSNQTDDFNYGGYGTSGRATVRDTYYSQKIYSLLGEDNPKKDQVQKYLLSCQNSVDGGFAEKNADASYGTSSVITSFFAFDALMTFDNQLGMLNEEVWFLPFDYVLLIIVLAIIIVVLAVGVRYYRKHRD